MKTRLNKSTLSVELGISRPTVHKYLQFANAPKPDGEGRYLLQAVEAFIKANAPRAMESEEIKILRERKLRLEVESKTFDLAVKNGEYVFNRDIEPVVAAASAELTKNLQMKFEQELPAKYKGRSVVEIQQMNTAAIDFILRRLREVYRPLLAD